MLYFYLLQKGAKIEGFVCFTLWFAWFSSKQLNLSSIKDNMAQNSKFLTDNHSHKSRVLFCNINTPLHTFRIGNQWKTATKCERIWLRGIIAALCHVEPKILLLWVRKCFQSLFHRKGSYFLVRVFVGFKSMHPWNLLRILKCARERQSRDKYLEMYCKHLLLSQSINHYRQSIWSLE